MPVVVAESTLDAILAHQCLVAWAGERRCQPPRLGWWDTDLVDPAGGGDLFARLLPQTHAWASLEAVREAARSVDAQIRRRMADPDRARTQFFLGFELDELLGDRLAVLKRGKLSPESALPFPVSLGGTFSSAELTQALKKAGTPEYSVVPGGRQLKGTMPSSPEETVKQLGAALLPFTDQYPLPFFRVPQ